MSTLRLRTGVVPSVGNFGDGGQNDTGTHLLFTAGTGAEQHGLFGRIIVPHTDNDGDE